MSKPAPALYCSFCGRPRAEVTALVVAPSVAICDICTMAAFLSLDEGQRRHALRCLHGQGHGVTVVTPQATDEAVAALLANPDTLRDLHRRTQAAEAEVHALRRQLEHAGRQWNEAVADRNRYQGWARQGKSLNRDLTAAIRAHLDARDRCDPSAEHATRQALDALLTETPRPDGAE
jgi:hypothetical protein